MTPTAGTVTRIDTRRSRLRVTPTARRLVERLQAEGGDVALVVAPRLSEEVLCVGRDDLTVGPHDVLVGAVRGCPIYVDRRDYSSLELQAMVLDVQSDLSGLKFVLRPFVGHLS